MRKRLVPAVVVCAALAAVLVWKCRGSDPAARAGAGGKTKVVAANGAHGAAAAAATRLDPSTQPRASIAGTVTDETKAVVAKARVCARVSSRHISGELIREPLCTTADDQGRYKLENLLTGEYRVTAGGKPYRPGSHHPGGDRKRTAFQLAAGEHKTGVDVVLRNGGVEITGTVSDVTGGPVARASVSAGRWRWGGGDDAPSVETDDQGKFSMWVAPGEISVYAFAEGYASGQDNGRAPGTFEILLTPESSFAGIVVDATSGQPVAGVQVQVDPNEWSGDDSNGHDITDAEGKFRVTRLSPGRYTARARSAQGFGRSEGSTLVGLGQHVDGVVVKLHASARVTAKIVKPDKSTCDRGWASLSDAASNRSQWADREPDGTLIFEGVLPGSYKVEVHCEGFLEREDYPRVEVKDKDIDGLAWDVDAGAVIRGRVLSQAGTPLEDVNVWGRNVGGAAREKTGWANDTSKADGSYELTGVRPGTFKLEVNSDDGIGPKDGWKVTVAAGTVAQQDLVLEDGGVIKGLVVDSGGKPVAGVRVNAMSLSGGWGGWRSGVRSQADGTFLIDNVRTGDYRVTASRGWWGNALRKPGSHDDAKQGERVSVGPKKTANVKLVVESQSGTISGTVVDSTGAPVADAYISAARESEAAGAQKTSVASTRWSFDEKPVLTSTEGKFKVEKLSPGNYTLRAYRKGGGEAVAEHVPVGGTAQLTIKATGGIAGTVKRPGGTIEELTITLADSKSGFSRTEQFFRTNGVFTLRDLPKGSFKLTAESAGGKQQVSLDLEEGQHKTGVEITLDALVTLTGRVVDAITKQPVASIRMFASLGKDGMGSFTIRGGDDNEENISGDDGRFKIKNAPRGAVTLQGMAKDWEGDYGWLTTVRTVQGDGTVDVGDVAIIKRRVKRNEPAGELGLKFEEAERGADLDKRKFKVSYIEPTGPAAKIDIKVGDEIVTVDGFDVTGDKYADGWTLMRAPPGTALKLGLARGVTVTIVLANPS